MKKIWVLFSPMMFILVGCFNTGSIARDSTVKNQLPPQINPDLPRSLEQKSKSQVKSEMETETRLSIPADYPEPVRPAQVTPENAHKKAEMLDQEMDWAMTH